MQHIASLSRVQQWRQCILSHRDCNTYTDSFVNTLQHTATHTATFCEYRLHPYESFSISREGLLSIFRRQSENVCVCVRERMCHKIRAHVDGEKDRESKRARDGRYMSQDFKFTSHSRCHIYKSFCLSREGFLSLLRRQSENACVWGRENMSQDSCKRG